MDHVTKVFKRWISEHVNQCSKEKEFVKKRFLSCKMLDYAIAVETGTTPKKDNLILNIDGCVAVCFVYSMRNCRTFSPEEAEDHLKMGVLNGLFVLGRSIGFIAYYLDQRRLRTGLHQHLIVCGI